MNVEALSLLEQISREKGIDPDTLIDALRSAVEAAARRRWPELQEMHSEFNKSTGEVEIFLEKTIVNSVQNEHTEVTLKQAKKINPLAELGETMLVRQVLEDYGRVAAQLAKQVILQKVREAEIEITYNDYIDKKDELVNGIAQRFDRGDLIVDLGKAEGILPRREQVFRETFNRGERIRAYVVDVKKTSKSAVVMLSRTHVGLVKRLFELEVPEISEGMVEIMGIVREPNGRTKIAVRTSDRDIDAVGACVGMRGMRVQSIVQELRGEKIDIVEYSEDPEVFVRNALSPAKITRVIKDEANKHMAVIVADDQMSLAIGKKGQNVRLAAKLVKWKVDITGESEASDFRDATALLSLSTPQKVDFLDVVKNTKGLGVKIMTILFSHDVVNLEEVLKRGLDGLVELPGIGPKKAEAILELANEYKLQKHAVAEPEEHDGSVYYKEPEETSDAVSEEIAADDESEEPEEQEEAEIPLAQLTGIDQKIVTLLDASGFETLAELSVTPIEELLEIEGIDEETGRLIISQAKEQVGTIEGS